ncbi:MAG: hypothetical protein AAGK21_18335, partial [Bacteroidota bacterium]
MPLAPPPPPLRLSTRPALALAAALAAGIGLARLVPTVSAGVWALVGTAGAVGLAVYLSRSQSRLVTLRPLGWALAVAAATIALGAAR